MKIQGWMIIFVAVMTVLSSANAFYDEALQAGDKVELDILVNNVQNLAGIQFSLNYNQDVLELINKEEGSFFENTYSTNGTLGNGSINDIILLNLNSGANGSGLLYKFYFDLGMQKRVEVQD